VLANVRPRLEILPGHFLGRPDVRCTPAGGHCLSIPVRFVPIADIRLRRRELAAVISFPPMPNHNDLADLAACNQRNFCIAKGNDQKLTPALAIRSSTF
jgi:hypothetical protein